MLKTEAHPVAETSYLVITDDADVLALDAFADSCKPVAEWN